MRVPPTQQPFTIEEYDRLDSAGKKKNLFKRVLERLNTTEEAFKQAQRRVLEANQTIESANAKAFAGNEELRSIIHDNFHLTAQLETIKGKWWFKLFNRFGL